MPDLVLSFNNPRLMDDVSLHPCVRYLRWEKQRILSFIPPDGKFRLFTYFIPNIRWFWIFISLRVFPTFFKIIHQLMFSTDHCWCYLANLTAVQFLFRLDSGTTSLLRRLGAISNSPFPQSQQLVDRWVLRFLCGMRIISSLDIG